MLEVSLFLLLKTSRQSLNNILADIEKRRADTLELIAESFSEDKEKDTADVNHRFDSEAAVAIQATVASLASKNRPGYEAESREDIEALLLNNRMPVQWAKKASESIWGGMNSDNPDLIPPPEPSGLLTDFLSRASSGPEPEGGLPVYAAGVKEKGLYAKAPAAGAAAQVNTAAAQQPVSMWDATVGEGEDATHKLRSPIRSPFRGLTAEEKAASSEEGVTHKLQFPLQSPFERR